MNRKSLKPGAGDELGDGVDGAEVYPEAEAATKILIILQIY
jgi:hypothetical protein